MRPWRFWWIDGPAAVVSGLLKAYVVIAYAATTVAFLMVLLVIAAYLLGIPL